jgi:hypothetical protein
MKKDYWWAPLTGVAFVVVAIVAFAVGGEPPGADEPAQSIANHYRDNDTAAMVGAALIGVAGTLLIFFAGFLRRALHEAEGESGVLSLVAFAGAVVLATGVAIDAMLTFAMAEAADKIQPAQLQTLQAVWDNDFMPMALGLQVFLLAAGLSIVRHGALATWMGWLAIVLAVTAITPAGFIAFMGGALWVLAASVMLALRARGAAAQPSAPSPTVSAAT